MPKKIYAGLARATHILAGKIGMIQVGQVVRDE
jgi:hypothetical protein